VFINKLKIVLGTLDISENNGFETITGFDSSFSAADLQ
jgi:hypothetical protein